MDALVHVKIINSGRSTTTNAVINLNYMMRCTSWMLRCASTGKIKNEDVKTTQKEYVSVFFTDGTSVDILGNYEEFITLVKKMCPSHSFEEF